MADFLLLRGDPGQGERLEVPELGKGLKTGLVCAETVRGCPASAMISADVFADVVGRPVSFIGVAARVAASRREHGSGGRQGNLANLCG
ncbi:MAG: hypothetical protein ACLQDY_22675 [Streptosporangiaceae bacterium]